MRAAEPHVANHYTHFLRRLERVKDDHLETAMALYTDHALVRVVLGRIALPEGVERVALALGAPHVGPFVVVTRDGHFVTCLGENMRPKNLFVVPRETLEEAARHLERVRDRLERTRHLERALETDAQLRWLAKIDWTSTAMSREDVAEIARWEPIVGDLLHQSFLVNGGLLEKSTERVRSIHPTSHTQAEDEQLHAWWNLFWNVTNLQAVIHFGDVQERCAAMDVALPRHQLSSALLGTFAGSVTMPIVTTIARGLWATMFHVEASLAHVGNLGARWSLHPIDRTHRTTMLATIAMGSRSGRDRALALLRASDALQLSPADAAYDAEIAPIVRNAIRDPETALDEFTAVAKQRVAAARGLDVSEIPDDVARALAITETADWTVDADARRLVAHALPWLAAADATELFAPQEWARPIPYSPARAHALVRSTLRARGIERREPVARAAQPERNGACACGSGQKYKRCCLRAPLKRAA